MLGLTMTTTAAQRRIRRSIRFARLRRRIDQMPPDAAVSVDALARCLARLSFSELSRAYAGFYWIAKHIRYDVEGFLRDDLGDLSPEAVLTRRTGVCAGYARLFQALAQPLRLQAVEVPGVAKGTDMAGDDARDGHAWNAVRIGRAWYLLDATWGAGYIDEQGQFVPRLQDFYFAPPPGLLINSHFPDVPRWQLLRRPLSRVRFDRLPYTTPAFFGHGLRWTSPVAARSTASDRLGLRLRMTQHAAVSVRLLNGEQEFPRRFALIERHQKQLEVQVRFPERGSYTLQLFAGPAGTEGVLTRAAQLGIDATAGCGWQTAFPETTTSFMLRQTQLLPPRDYQLQAWQPVRFDVLIPGAREVAVTDASGEWHILSRRGQRFIAKRISLPPGQVDLAANFGAPSTQFEVLARYSCD